jgi:broad specificity polyphosphatase/5'/3'-nucleotidase SurE
MERITQRTVALAVAIMLGLATLAMSASKTESSSKYLTIQGKVLHINQKARQLLVSDSWTKKLYLVNVPEGAGFRITFGMNMKLSEPAFRDVRRNDRVRLRCERIGEHLARLDDGREVVVMTAASN